MLIFRIILKPRQCNNITNLLQQEFEKKSFLLNILKAFFAAVQFYLGCHCPLEIPL